MGQPGPHQVAVTHDLSYIFMDVLLYWQLCFEEQVAAFYWSLDHLVVHCVPLCELQKRPPFPGTRSLGVDAAMAWVPDEQTLGWLRTPLPLAGQKENTFHGGSTDTFYTFILHLSRRTKFKSRLILHPSTWNA